MSLLTFNTHVTRQSKFTFILHWYIESNPMIFYYLMSNVQFETYNYKIYYEVLHALPLITSFYHIFCNWQEGQLQLLYSMAPRHTFRRIPIRAARLLKFYSPSVCNVTTELLNGYSWNLKLWWSGAFVEPCQGVCHHTHTHTHTHTQRTVYRNMDRVCRK
jgi:hypothetical protein